MSQYYNLFNSIPTDYVAMHPLKRCKYNKLRTNIKEDVKFI